MTQDELYDEYSLWLEAHGLHEEEEPPEDTFVGYDDDGEEIHMVAVRRIVMGADFGFENLEVFWCHAAEVTL